MLQFVTAGALSLISAYSMVSMVVSHLDQPGLVGAAPLILGLVSLASVALMGRECYRHFQGVQADIAQRRRHPLHAYGLTPWLAALAFAANHALISNAFLVGAGLGQWRMVGWIYSCSAMIALLSLLAAGPTAWRSGRQAPLTWRLAVITGVIAVPAWCLGAAAALAPFKGSLLAWYWAASHS